MVAPYAAALKRICQQQQDKKDREAGSPFKMGGGAAALVNILCSHSSYELTMKEST
jgi:hypothetical protein